MQINRINTTSNHRWERYRTQREVYSALKNPDNNAIYTLMYSIFNQHEMTTRPDLCHSLRVYDDVGRLARGRRPPRISGHWMYSINVPLSRTVEIDRDIVAEKVRRERIIVKEDLPERCKPKLNRIDWLLLVMFFAVAQGPPLILLMLAFIFLTLRRRKNRGPPAIFRRRGSVGTSSSTRRSHTNNDSVVAQRHSTSVAGSKFRTRS